MKEHFKEKDLFTLHVMIEMPSSYLEEHKRYTLWSCQKVCEALTFLLENIYNRFGTKLPDTTRMLCDRLHAWWLTQSRLTTLQPSFIARRWVGLRLNEGSGLKSQVGWGSMFCLWSTPPGVQLLDFVSVLSCCWVLILFHLYQCWILIYMFAALIPPNPPVICYWSFKGGGSVVVF